MKPITLTALFLAIFVTLTACASVNIPPSGNISVEITGIPEPCEANIELFVEIRGEHGGYYPGNFKCENGKVTCVPKTGPHGSQDATNKFMSGERITVTITFVNLDPACEVYLENQVFHFDIGEGSEVVSKPTKPTTVGGREWQLNLGNFKKPGS